MRRVRSLIVALLFAPAMASLLSGCGEGAAPTIVPAKAPPAVPVEAAYLPPPSVTATRLEGANLVLIGAAPADARVRLATPEGETRFATANDKGVWTLVLPGAAQPRIFGLSATAGARQLQAEGYVLITPAGEAVLLRAGTGAARVGRTGKNGLDVVDFDREGGAVVSGRAPAGAALSIHIDGRQLAEGRADASGRYVVALTQQPLAGGMHQVDVFGDATENTVNIDTTPAPPLASGPFRATTVPAGLRIDWMTPGGGAQSTIILK